MLLQSPYIPSPTHSSVSQLDATGTDIQVLDASQVQSCCGRFLIDGQSLRATSATYTQAAALSFSPHNGPALPELAFLSHYWRAVASHKEPFRKYTYCRAWFTEFKRKQLYVCTTVTMVARLYHYLLYVCLEGYK